MRAVGTKPRRIRSLVGEQRYVRDVFECPRCRRSYAPMDGELGVRHGDQMTGLLRRRVAWGAARRSYKEAAEDLWEYQGLKVSLAEYARVAQEEGERLERRHRQQEAKWSAAVEPGVPVEPPESVCERLVIEADATTVLTVADEEHKSVYCAVAFGLENRGQKDGSGRPFLTQKRYTGSAVDMEDFAQRVDGLVDRMGARWAKAIAFIGDGAPCLWKYAQTHLPPGTVLIQDYWHVVEHLAELAKDLYGPGARCMETRQRWKVALRESRLDAILADLRAQQKLRRGAKRKRVQQEIRYLENGRDRMDYARYERNGWPIGSGAVEGSCKHLVKERFCVTGAHWRRANIPKTLALRLSIFNGQWEEDWENALAA